MKKKEIWCAKHPSTGNIMVAVIRRLGDSLAGGLFEIKINDIIYQTGYDDWEVGDVTALTENSLKKPKEVVKFMFEEI